MPPQSPEDPPAPPRLVALMPFELVPAVLITRIPFAVTVTAPP